MTNQGVTSFLPDFIDHVKSQGDANFPQSAKTMTKDEFDALLLGFLTSQNGYSWISSIKFKEPFSPISNKLPEIIALTFTYNHVQFESSVGYIKAMNEMFDVIEKHKENLNPESGRVFAHSEQYSDYVTIEILPERSEFKDADFLS